VIFDTCTYADPRALQWCTCVEPAHRPRSQNVYRVNALTVGTPCTHGITPILPDHEPAVIVTSPFVRRKR